MKKKEKILNFNEKIDFDKSTYNFKDKRITKIDFNDFDNVINFLKMIGDGKIKINTNQIWMKQKRKASI